MEKLSYVFYVIVDFTVSTIENYLVLLSIY